VIKNGIDISSIRGLSEDQAGLRLKTEGRNEPPSSKPRDLLAVTFDVAREPMVLLILPALKRHRSLSNKWTVAGEIQQDCQPKNCGVEFE
jgi:Cation transporter/ATPase, N-terminus